MTEFKPDPILIANIRKHMPALIANDLVGVQPMSGAGVGDIISMKVIRTPWWRRMIDHFVTLWHERIFGEVWLQGGIAGPLPCCHTGVWVKKDRVREYLDVAWSKPHKH